ncbi:hypothetical protein LPJ57_004702, partial [Coemansia sp. RSA 486]
AIADTWPRTMADHAARTDWGWNPLFGTADIARIMLDKLRPVYAAPNGRSQLAPVEAIVAH